MPRRRAISMALTVTRIIGADSEGADLGFAADGHRCGRSRGIRRQRIGGVGGHHADAAFLHDFIDDHHAFVVDVLAILPGDLQMCRAGAVGEKKKNILRRAVGNEAGLARRRCKQKQRRCRVMRDRLVRLNSSFFTGSPIFSAKFAGYSRPRYGADRAKATTSYSRREI